MEIPKRKKRIIKEDSIKYTKEALNRLNQKYTDINILQAVLFLICNIYKATIPIREFSSFLNLPEADFKDVYTAVKSVVWELIRQKKIV